MSGPPPDLVHTLVEGSGLLSGLEWHPEIDSTNRRAADLAAEGADELYAVVADVQTAGRGRHGRGWHAPAGTSLMVSLLCRPTAPADALPLLPLLAGVALVDAAAPHCPGVTMALKWPNDVLAGGRKAAGILAETVAVAAVIGVGVNVDWRGHELPEGATSLSHEAGTIVDRWKLLAGLAGVFANRYRTWLTAPTGFLDGYRERCATLGRQVRVELAGGRVVEGVARDVDSAGRLLVDGAPVSAGDVTHLR